MSTFGTWLDSYVAKQYFEKKLEVGKGFPWLGGPAGMDLWRERFEGP